MPKRKNVYILVLTRGQDQDFLAADHITDSVDYTVYIDKENQAEAEVFVKVAHENKNCSQNARMCTISYISEDCRGRRGSCCREGQKESQPRQYKSKAPKEQEAKTAGKTG